jgi:hypothetical protein
VNQAIAEINGLAEFFFNSRSATKICCGRDKVCAVELRPITLRPANCQFCHARGQWNSEKRQKPTSIVYERVDGKQNATLSLPRKKVGGLRK